jgi:uncharacterized Fe-S cluster-containing radical SAM superfamily protein
MNSRKLVNPIEKGAELRQKLVRDKKILCADFTGTVQAEDIRKRNDLIQDVDTGAYCYRAKINVKDFDDNERAKKNLPPFDFSDLDAIYKALKFEFDIPLWFLRGAGDQLENIKHYNLPMILQLKGCNFHDGTEIGGCTFCFVDNKSNSGEQLGGIWLSPQNVVNTYKSISDKLDIHVIRVSGGEPTLVLDFILDLYETLQKKGIKAQMQFDTNLSTGRLIDQFIGEGTYPLHILDMIAEFNPKVLVAFKGTDNENLQSNIQADCTIEDQIYSLKKFVKAGIDVYPYIYNPNPDTLSYFIDSLEQNFSDILPKIHIGKLNVYEVTKNRLRLMAIEQDTTYDELLAKYTKEWTSNYERSCEIMDELMIMKYGVAYKGMERPSIQIKLRQSQDE